MSHTHPTPASSSSSNFQVIIDNALDMYKTRTKNDLRAHPLAAQLQTCDSPTAILSVLRQQVQGLDQSRSTDERWTKWLDPTINVLSAFSDTIGAGVTLVFSPASVIFAGVGVLLSTVKGVRASHDTLVDIFERIELFFRRLEIYTKVQPTGEMMNLIIQIMTEVISILGITTKEMNRGRIKKYVKKLIGSTEIEDALGRLDKLTHEESWMGIAQNLLATHTVGESVRGVADQVVAIDNRVVGVDNRVANIDSAVKDVGAMVVAVDDKVKVVDEKVAEVIRDGKDMKVALQQTATVTDVDQVKVVVQQTAANVDQVKVVVQQTAANVDQVKRNQSRETIHKWLSPPDPSTNHNIACGTHNKKPASWVFQGSIFQEWKSTGSLLWLHGKPGSGKNILCSTVIQDIEAMCKAGNASMAYFYFDFRDANKKGQRDLVPSLLTQLAARSGPRCDILSNLYLDHDEGKNQPSDTALTECLKAMLTLPDRRPTYLIIDALDESPNNSGIPSPRERVINLLKELVELRLPNLCICVTSRPEIDIRDVLEPLTPHRVSLHEQSGQKQDIEDYVKSVVYSNSEPIMKRWRMEDKDLVIKVLSERADGMFRWIFCQLEVLRQCIPPSVRRTLDELPETLDETYERVLKEIKKPNRVHAIRLLQCLVAAIRPLRVEELAEVLAVDFDDEEGMPKLNPNWRWGDEEQALLASCSSLITIVESNVKSDVESDVEPDEAQNVSRVVQFSHFSVKEYLTSDRLATSGGDISRYHIDLQPAHTILAQACMAVLLRSDHGVEDSGVGNSSPLAGYAAEHWVVHALDEKVSSCIRKAMSYLFDEDKPYFAAWIGLHDIDIDASYGSTFYLLTERTEPGSLLYYAARCGLQDLVEHLVANDPKQVNAIGGYYQTPMVAALEGGHFQTAKFLYDNGAHPNVGGYKKTTPLQSAAYYGDFEMVRLLFKYKADVHAQDVEGKTPLHFLSQGFNDRSPNIAALFPNLARVLVEHGADVNARTNDGITPLHVATCYGTVEAIRVLLGLGADVNARENDDTTPMHQAAQYGSVEVIRMLVELGADVNARRNDDTTPLHQAAQRGSVEVIRVLVELGADVNARKNDDTTLLHQATQSGSVEVIRMLVELGVDVNARENDDTTPLHQATQSGSVDVIRMLVELGADVNARKNDDTTPLHQAARRGSVEVIRMLLELGADVNARKHDDTTPLHIAMEYASVKVILMLVELGADVNARKNDDTTLLHHAARRGSVEVIRMLVELDADVNARNNDDATPLHEATRSGIVEAIRMLVELGADVNARKNDHTTPLHIAIQYASVEVILMLVELGADVNAQKNDDTTPLHIAAEHAYVEDMRVLLEHGANVGVEDGHTRTASQIASEKGHDNILTLLSEHGAT